MLSEETYTTLAEDLGRVLTVGPRANALLAALPDPWEPLATTGEATPARTSQPTPSAERPIPTLESDNLLASARGRWRMPRALQRQDFELAFRAVDHEATWASVLEKIRGGTFPTQANLAKTFKKAASWSRSLMWHAIKSKEVADYKAWCAFFPKRPKARTKTAKPRDTAHSEPLPRSIFDDEAYSQEQ